MGSKLSTQTLLFYQSFLVQDHNSPTPIYTAYSNPCLVLQANGTWKEQLAKSKTDYFRVSLEYCKMNESPEVFRKLILDALPSIPIISETEVFTNYNKQLFSKVLYDHSIKLTDVKFSYPGFKQLLSQCQKFKDDLPIKDRIFLFPDPEFLGVVAENPDLGLGAMVCHHHAAAVRI